MTFLRSIVTFLAVCLCVGVAYAFGHGLSSHNSTAFIVAALMLLAGAGIVVALTRQRGDMSGWTD